MLLSPVVLGFASPAEDATMPRIIFFHSLNCHKCTKVISEFMPEIKDKFVRKVAIDYRDIGDIENYRLLLGLKGEYGYKGNNDLPVVFLEGEFLSGVEQIKENLPRLIEYALNKPESKVSLAVSASPLSHFLGFRPLAVASAGLVDGINPCAFTVIVFFISFLALQGYRKRELIVIGLCFILAVFATYLLIGIGSFGFLYRLNEFWILAKIINFSIGLFSIILGCLAVYDFCRLKKTGNSEELILQLPHALKNQIHRVIGLHYRVNKSRQTREVLKRHLLRLIASALITGFLVSILEAVCTGQTYLPTITFILKSGQLRLHALAYLLLYNFMFIAPLLAIFFFALLGVTSGQFSAILKRHMLVIKMLMAILFFGLGILLIWNL